MWRWGVSAGAVALALSWGGLARAQSAPSDPPPPLVQNVDGNGVDLVTGAFHLADPQAAIGPSTGGLVRLYENMALEDNYYGAINSSGSTYTVSVGGSSETFTRSGNSFTSSQATGSTLAVDASGEFYSYVTSSGATASFDTAYAGSIPTQANVARITSLRSAAGEATSFTYSQGQFTFTFPGGLPQTIKFWRLAVISNNRGLSLTYNYTAPTSWVLASVQSGNSAAAASGPFPAVSFSGSAGGAATDALGRQTVYTLPGASSRQTITRPSGEVQTIVYDASSRVTSYSNGVGTWTYSWGTTSGSPSVTITDPAPNGGTRTVVSNPSLDAITSSIDALGRITSYVYDNGQANGPGHLTQVTYPHGTSVQYVYDAHGNVTQTTQVAAPGSGLPNIVTSATYPCSTPATCNKPSSTTDARGYVTYYTYWSDPNTGYQTGQLATVTYPAQGPNNVRPQTRYTYTPEQANLANGATGAPIYLLTGVSSCNGKSATGSSNCIGAADETRITIAYDASHNLAPASVTTAAGDGSVSSTQSFAHDGVGNLYASTSPLGAVTRYLYDAGRELVGLVGPDPDGGGPLTPTAVRLTYDNGGQLVGKETGTVNSQSDADWGGFAQAFFDFTARDSLERPLASYRGVGPISGGYTAYTYTQYRYDNANRLVCTAVRLNMSAFNSLPQACSLSTPGVDGQQDRITQLSYDAADELIQSTSGVGATNAAGQSIARNDVTDSYNPDGTLGYQTDANNNKTCYVYDGFGRLITKQFPTPSNGGVCNGSDTENLSYDPNSNVNSHRLRDGTVFSYQYDALNRLTSDYNTAYTYDNVGRIKTAGSVSFTYDALGRKLTETGASGKTMTSAYDAAGDRISLTWPDGTYVAYGRDLLGRTTNIEENGAASGVGLLANYTYNSLGQLTNVGLAGSTYGQGLAYDGIGRLSLVGYGFGDPSKNTYLGLAYTADSRIKVRTQSNNLYEWAGPAYAQTNYAINGLNQTSPTGGAFTYDPRGSLYKDGVNTYSYNVYSRLTAVSGSANVNLSYDGLQRLSQTQASSTTQFVYDGSMITEELDGSGNLLRRYVPGPDGTPLVWYEGSGLGDRRWLMKDQQGSVVAVANGSGQVRDIYAYDPYGYMGAGWSGNMDLSRHLYAGYPFIPEDGLYNTGARTYSPTLGRFLQTDPIGYGDGMNWYAYTHGDPVNGTDPTGLCDGGTDPDGTIVVIACPEFTPSEAAQELLGAFRDGLNLAERAAQRLVAAVKPKASSKSNSCGKPSPIPHGGGVQFGGTAEAGLPGVAGVSATASAGGGLFYSGNRGLSAGGFVSGGGAGYGGGASGGFPSQGAAPVVAGASAGIGFSGFITNAQSVQQLSGPFTTYSGSIGEGPAQVSVQLSVGGGIYDLSVGPPVLGVAGGASASRITTTTATTGGCT